MILGGNKNDAEAYEAIADARLVPVPIAGAAVPREDMPRSAPYDTQALVAASQPCPAIGGGRAVVVVPYVFAPLPGQPAHVIQPPRIRLFLPDRMRPTAAIA